MPGHGVVLKLDFLSCYFLGPLWDVQNIIVLFVLLAFSGVHILSSQIISLRPLGQCDGFANSLRLPPSLYFRALSS